MFFDPVYLMFALPGLLFGMWAQHRVKSTFAHASRFRNRRGLTGRDVAQSILDSSGVSGVTIEPAHGFLTDHYHPLLRKLRLSEPVYASDSLAAVGVAAHEVGHAIQHARGYLPLSLRSVLVPVCQVGSWIGQIAMLVGVGFAMGGRSQTILLVAIAGYSAVFLFTLITLPVEFNASSRALAVLSSQGILDEDELPEAKRVLDAAALTYVASAVQILLVILYLLSVLNRRNDR